MLLSSQTCRRRASNLPHCSGAIGLIFRQGKTFASVSLRADLEKLAPGILAAEGEMVYLRRHDLRVDVHDFMALASADDFQSIEKGAKLYRGAFLEGLEIESEAFKEWSQSKRNHLECIAVQTFVKLAEQADGLGRGPEAISAVQHLIAIDPFNEVSQRLTLKIYGQHLGWDAAIAYGREFGEFVKRELGILPEPETLALINEIKKQKPVSAPTLFSDARSPFESTDNETELTRSEETDVGTVRRRQLAAPSKSSILWAALTSICVPGRWLAITSSPSIQWLSRLCVSSEQPRSVYSYSNSAV